MAKALARFTIQPSDDGYTLHIEDDGGETLELTATAEQLDIIAEAIEDHLDAEGDEIDAVA